MWFFLNIYTALVLIILKSALLLCLDIHMKMIYAISVHLFFHDFWQLKLYNCTSKLLHYEKKILNIFFDFFILDTKMTWKNKTTKILTTINSIHIQVETNSNKNSGVSEQVQALCFGDGLSTRDKHN